MLLFCSEDEGVEVPVPQCRINFTFSGTSLKAHEALTAFALQTLDRVTRLKLSKDVSPLVYVPMCECYVCACVCVCVCEGGQTVSQVSAASHSELEISCNTKAPKMKRLHVLCVHAHAFCVYPCQCYEKLPKPMLATYKHITCHRIWPTQNQ